MLHDTREEKDYIFSKFKDMTCVQNDCVFGNKMPTRCNRGFYCRSYCLLNMFRASLCPSSGAQEYYTVVAACGILCCGFSSSWSGVELRVMRPVCRMLAFYFHILTTMHGQNQIKDCVFV